MKYLAEQFLWMVDRFHIRFHKVYIYCFINICAYSNLIPRTISRKSSQIFKTLSLAGEEVSAWP